MPRFKQTGSPDSQAAFASSLSANVSEQFQAIEREAKQNPFQQARTTRHSTVGLNGGVDGMDHDHQETQGEKGKSINAPIMSYPMTSPYAFKALVFLRCTGSHVFTLPGVEISSINDNYVNYIFAPCPQCSPSSGSAPPDCPFCWWPLEELEDGTNACVSEDCWLGNAVVHSSSDDEALAVWDNVWRKMGNMYFTWQGEEREWITGYSNGEIRKVDGKRLHVTLPRAKGVPLSFTG
ncbi:hypothetical protein BR93DRAFT_935997 [Coniochaeta sp. PMI_546]|nr:hypothetical protein BR93DRAFT_935997 [Coniochaeta sp. PMI_546]